MQITMKNQAGMVKEVKKGFSWTTFFFGIFVPLIRGDFKWAGIFLLATVVLSAISFGTLAWVPGVVMSFVYNKVYIKDLYEKGYRPTDTGLDELVLNYVNS